METTCFLSANTSEGFASCFDSLFTDPRIGTVTVIKGGSGCGKSTLMKALADRARALGHDTERILCSSDPDSLDGVVIPDAGMAWVDGTAPHVVEPPLCGCGAGYLDLSVCLDAAALKDRQEALRLCRAQNAACYPPAYALLRAAGVLQQSLQSFSAPCLTPEAADLALAQLLPELPAPADRPCTARCRWYTAVTPDGLLAMQPRVRTLWALEDGFGAGGPLLERLRDAFVRAGAEVTVLRSILSPETPSGLLVPEAELGFVRCEPLFCLGREAPLRLDLDSLTAQRMPAAVQTHCAFLQRQIAALAQQAVRWLRRAKKRHDRLEALYRPAVDFDAVEALTRRELDRLDRRLGRRRSAPRRQQALPTA